MSIIDKSLKEFDDLEAILLKEVDKGKDVLGRVTGGLSAAVSMLDRFLKGKGVDVRATVSAASRRVDKVIDSTVEGVSTLASKVSLTADNIKADYLSKEGRSKTSGVEPPDEIESLVATFSEGVVEEDVASHLSVSNVRNALIKLRDNLLRLDLSTLYGDKLLSVKTKLRRRILDQLNDLELKIVVSQMAEDLTPSLLDSIRTTLESIRSGAITGLFRKSSSEEVAEAANKVREERGTQTPTDTPSEVPTGDSTPESDIPQTRFQVAGDRADKLINVGKRFLNPAELITSTGGWAARKALTLGLAGGDVAKDTVKKGVSSFYNDVKERYKSATEKNLTPEERDALQRRDAEIKRVKEEAAELRRNAQLEKEAKRKAEIEAEKHDAVERIAEQEEEGGGGLGILGGIGSMIGGLFGRRRRRRKPSFMKRMFGKDRKDNETSRDRASEFISGRKDQVEESKEEVRQRNEKKKRKKGFGGLILSLLGMAVSGLFTIGSIIMSSMLGLAGSFAWALIRGPVSLLAGLSGVLWNVGKYIAVAVATGAMNVYRRARGMPPRQRGGKTRTRTRGKGPGIRSRGKFGMLTSLATGVGASLGIDYLLSSKDDAKSDEEVQREFQSHNEESQKQSNITNNYHSYNNTNSSNIDNSHWSNTGDTSNLAKEVAEWDGSMVEIEKPEPVGGTPLVSGGIGDLLTDLALFYAVDKGITKGGGLLKKGFGKGKTKLLSSLGMAAKDAVVPSVTRGGAAAAKVASKAAERKAASLGGTTLAKAAAGTAGKTFTNNAVKAGAKTVVKSATKKVLAKSAMHLGKLALGLFTGPVGWAVTLGMLAWDAYDLYTWYQDGKGDFPDTYPGNITKLRFLSYGIDDDNKDGVPIAAELEELLKNNFIKNPSKGTVEFKRIDEEQGTKIMKLFGDPEGVEAEIAGQWFNERFIPNLTAFHNAIFTSGVNASTGDIAKLGNSELLRIVRSYQIPMITLEYTQLPFGVGATAVNSTDIEVLRNYLLNELSTAEENSKHTIQSKLQEKLKEIAPEHAASLEDLDKTGGVLLGGVAGLATKRNLDSRATINGGEYKPMGVAGAIYSNSETIAGAESLSNGPGFQSGTHGAYSLGDGAGGEFGGIGADQISIPDAIKQSAEATGTPEDTLWTTAKMESGLDPTVKSKWSSATGLFQFLDGTWNEMVKKKGGKYGLTLANADRTNPLHNALMGGEYLKTNIKALSQYAEEIGMDPGLAGYMGNFFGTGGATKLFKAYLQNPNALMSSVFDSKIINSHSDVMKGKSIAQFFEIYRQRWEKHQGQAWDGPHYLAGRHRNKYPELYKNVGKTSERRIPDGSNTKDGTGKVSDFSDAEMLDLTGFDNSGRSDTQALNNGIGSYVGDAGAMSSNAIGTGIMDIKNPTRGSNSGSGIDYDTESAPGRSSTGNNSISFGAEVESKYIQGDDQDGAPVVVHCIPPNQTYRYTSLYGKRDTGLQGASKNHGGIDIAGTRGVAGMPILATGSGKVIKSWFSQSYGNVVYIAHPSGYQTRYAHLQKRAVNNGDQVKAGQLVGTMGKTSNKIKNMAVHLHYEVRKGHEESSPTIDPMSFAIFKDSFKGLYKETVNDEVNDPNLSPDVEEAQELASEENKLSTESSSESNSLPSTEGGVSESSGNVMSDSSDGTLRSKLENSDISGADRSVMANDETEIAEVLPTSDDNVDPAEVEPTNERMDQEVLFDPDAVMDDVRNSPTTRTDGLPGMNGQDGGDGSSGSNGMSHTSIMDSSRGTSPINTATTPSSEKSIDPNLSLTDMMQKQLDAANKNTMEMTSLLGDLLSAIKGLAPDIGESVGKNIPKQQATPDMRFNQGRGSTGIPTSRV